jgi:iron-sulfur cluster assembly protein
MTTIELTLQDDEVLLDRLLTDGVDIAHDCGGVLACASCRVVVREGQERFGMASERELYQLDRADTVAPGARLACQVRGSGELVVEIPRAAPPVHERMLPVSVSERAARHFTAQLTRHPGAVAVRLAAVTASCSGFRYRVDPSGGARDGDHIFESRGLRIVVDAASLPYLQGMTLDVIDDGLNRRVRFDNPNARHSCGCGESFGV